MQNAQPSDIIPAAKNQAGTGVLEIINTISTAIMALFTVAMFFSAWYTYKLNERVLLANEEPSITVKNIRLFPQHVVYDYRNSGSISIRNLSISNKIFTEDMFDGSTLPIGFPGTAQSEGLFPPGKTVSFKDGWVSANPLDKQILQGNGRRLVVLELGFRCEHEITHRKYEQSTQYICLPSNHPGFECIERTDKLMKMFRLNARRTLHKK